MKASFVSFTLMGIADLGKDAETFMITEQEEEKRSQGRKLKERAKEENMQEQILTDTQVEQTKLENVENLSVNII
jgi:hypothetical protein